VFLLTLIILTPSSPPPPARAEKDKLSHQEKYLKENPNVERIWSLEEQFEDACARVTANERKLRNISFRNWGMKKYGCAKLAIALRTNSSLAVLDLGNNILGNDGVGHLVQVLPTIRLKLLDLRDNGIGDDGATLLSSALATHESLTTLLLVDNAIADDGAIAISQMLVSSHALKLVALLPRCLQSAAHQFGAHETLPT
jgi:Ran GTPase-activating protein (RanGAP) involved in mRNA processing and transport